MKLHNNNKNNEILIFLTEGVYWDTVTLKNVIAARKKIIMVDLPKKFKSTIIENIITCPFAHKIEIK